MLTFAIASFFAFALCGAMMVIGTMFLGYREQIIAVLLQGADREEHPTVTEQAPFKVRQIKPRQTFKNRGLQPSPLSAAA